MQNRSPGFPPQHSWIRHLAKIRIFYGRESLLATFLLQLLNCFFAVARRQDLDERVSDGREREEELSDAGSNRLHEKMEEDETGECQHHCDEHFHLGAILA